jgi:hypothetical protein
MLQPTGIHFLVQVTQYLGALIDSRRSFTTCSKAFSNIEFLFVLIWRYMSILCLPAIQNIDVTLHYRKCVQVRAVELLDWCENAHTKVTRTEAEWTRENKSYLERHRLLLRRPVLLSFYGFQWNHALKSKSSPWYQSGTPPAPQLSLEATPDELPSIFNISSELYSPSFSPVSKKLPYNALSLCTIRYSFYLHL